MTDTLDEYYEGKRKYNFKGTYVKKADRLKHRYEKRIKGGF